MNRAIWEAGCLAELPVDSGEVTAAARRCTGPGAYVEINGRPLYQPYALQKGDRFKVGQQEIVYG